MKTADARAKPTQSRRQRAEQKLREKPSATHAPTGADLNALVHELQVHQIELEQQNEELRQTREREQEIQAQYLDLFDFAPIGYFELNQNGVIDRVNVAGATLLGLNRSQVTGRRFDHFVLPECRPVFAQFAQRVLAANTRQTCELMVRNHGKTPRYVLLEGLVATTRPGSKRQWRLSAIDFTARKQAETVLEAARQDLELSVHDLSLLVLELTHAEQQERTRLTHTLHEHLQQLLVSAKFSLEALRKHTRTSAGRETIQSVDHTLDEAIKACRALTAELSPAILNEGQLVPALEWLGDWMRKTHGLSVKVEGRPSAPVNNEKVAVLLYQAVRELLFNVAKHAGVKAAQVIVAVNQDQ